MLFLLDTHKIINNDRVNVFYTIMSEWIVLL